MPTAPLATAPLAELRAFLAAHPSAAEVPALRAAHDRRLLPCPEASVAGCRSREPVVVRGMRERAERYPRECLDCTARDAVAAIAARLAPLDDHFRTVAAQASLERGATQGLEAMEQAIADASAAGIAPDWVARAEARFARRARQLGRPGATVDRGCHVPAGWSVLVSPASPMPATSVTVVAVADDGPATATLRLTTAEGARAEATTTAVAGPRPRAYFTSALDLGPGGYRAELVAAGARILCTRFVVRARATFAPNPPALATTTTTATATAWRASRGWTRDDENLYAAWLGRLLDAPEPTAWRGLESRLGDPRHNFLFAHLGLGEDAPGGLPAAVLSPDCADAPYFFRAYFAWKLGLPFAWHGGSEDRGSTRGSTRGSDAQTASEFTPTYAAPTATEGPRPTPLGPVTELFRTLREEVVARTLRRRFDDDAADLYPLALTRDALRPGAVYADPYGHTLTLVRWLEQQGEAPGKLLAVDAQPDGTIAIKRFWRGTFIFAGPSVARGHGFKAFRPLLASGDGFRPLTNAELSLAAGYGDFSDEQAELEPPAFYARMRALVSPGPVEPRREYRALHEALLAQLRARVRAIELGEEHRRESPGATIAMPPGRGVFGTVGDWEAFSTPCRDLRLLVGMDALFAYPAEAVATGASGGDPTLAADLARLHAEWSRSLTFEYRRSDGAVQRLSLADVFARQTELERAYNPNDCPELRWGAPPGSPEARSCAHSAPADQHARMEAYRHWFRQRYACG